MPDPVLSLEVRDLQPVHNVSSEKPTERLRLCLSGGGYRAMLFHPTWRLSEASLLKDVKRVSSGQVGRSRRQYWASVGRPRLAKRGRHQPRRARRFSGPGLGPRNDRHIVGNQRLRDREPTDTSLALGGIFTMLRKQLMVL
jgi:hypothetical protein